MQDDFPTLTPNQWAIVMTDGATGHVLLESSKVSTSNDDVIYKVFESNIEAEKYIKLKQEENDTWEFGIYDHTNKMIQDFPAKRWAQRPTTVTK